MTLKKSDKNFSSAEQIFNKYIPSYSSSNEKQANISGKVGIEMAKDLLIKFEQKIHNPKQTGSK